MKTMILAMMLFTLGYTGVAATLEQWQERAAAAKTVYEKFDAALWIELLSSPPQTFAELESTVRKNVAAHYSDQLQIERMTVDATSRIARNHFEQKFLAEGWAYAKQHLDSADLVAYLVYYDPRLGLPESEQYEMLLWMLLNRDLTAPNTQNALQRLSRVALSVEADQVKNDLTRLNRLYTQKLVSDRANFEPVVVAIRTLLSAY